MYCIALLLFVATAAYGANVRAISRTGEGVYQEFMEALDTRSNFCSVKGGSKLSKSEQAEYLKLHNECRGKEGAGLPDMTWNDALAKRAQDLVNRFNNCDMQHTEMECDGKRMGQNLAWDWLSKPQTENMPASKAMEMWYGEKKDYNYRSNSCRGVCGHYTQIVWKDTTEVGCASRICGKSRLVACDYYPPGNWMGKKPY